MTAFFTALLNSLDIGLLLFVIAVGLNIVFGVLNVINFAHGALYMIGAYLGFSLIAMLGWPFWAALNVAPLGVAALAVVLDRLVLRFIYGLCYIADLASLRSLIWFAAVACTVGLFLVAAMA